MGATLQAVEAVGHRRKWTWVAPFALAALVLALYGPVLKALVGDWWTDPDYGHGFFVPLFSAWVLWTQRDGWLRLVPKPSNWGFVVMLGAVGLLLAGSLGAELFTSRFSLIVLLAGMVLFVAGREVLRAVSLPLGFLIFMIPLPTIIYNQITFPLQLVASRFAVFCLQVMNVPALREGNIISLPRYTLEVVDACSGIRSLMTLLALAVAYGYFAEKRGWARLALAVLMIPVAILCNGFRVFGTGMLTYHFGSRAAEGFFHEFSGLVIFVCALLLLLAVHKLLKVGANLAGSRTKHA